MTPDRPMTLRDARRLLARPEMSSYGSWGWWVLCYLKGGGAIPRSADTTTARATTDRLIARLGAGFRLDMLTSETARDALSPRTEKESSHDHMKPSASDDRSARDDSVKSAEHSGDCRAGSAGGSRPKPSGEGTQSESGVDGCPRECGDERRSLSTAANERDSDDPAIRQDGARDRGSDGSANTANDGAQLGSDDCAHAGEQGPPDEAPSGDSRASDGASNQTDGQIDSVETHYCSPSRHSRFSSGGAAVDLSLRGKDRRFARRIAAVLRRFLRVDRGAGDCSPRIDGKRLVAEMASRRMAFARARRPEVARELCVLAVDVSGSCSSFSEDLWLAATVVAAECGGDVITFDEADVAIDPACPMVVVAHSNGWLAVGERQVGLDEFICRAGRPLSTVIALGDGDAAGHYQALCERGQRFFWLDNYAAKHGPARASTSCAQVSSRCCSVLSGHSDRRRPH